MSYVMKWRYVVGVFLLLCICVLPASAADGFGVEKIESEYLILPLNIEDLIEPRSSISSSVMQGQARYFNHYVTPGSTEIEFQLSWPLSPNYNSLKLQILDPEGLVVEEFTDTHDNPNPNGLIHLKIINTHGLKQGNWIFVVVGVDVVGIQLFSLGVNSY
ncbi:MAG: hypothetical protein E7Z72_02030 [Methanocorpusculum parvum]|nr:hypothetical protein [Methanocorpusculum parvum]